MIILETVSRLVDDEDNQTLAGFIGVCGHLAAETGAAVIVSHHPTKAASKENDSSPESARGGGALINNCRTAVSLFPVNGRQTPPYLKGLLEKAGVSADEANVLVLEHAKSTSSVRKQSPLVLLRESTPHGAVLRLPQEILRGVSPEQARAGDERKQERAAEKQRVKQEQLTKVYDLVKELKRGLGRISANKLVNYKDQLGVAKHAVEPLVLEAVSTGVLVVSLRDKAGRILDMELGFRPGDVSGSLTTPAASDIKLP